MSGDWITGSCICGDVSFEVADDFMAFKLCHCDYCQKSSGSAFIANAFASPGQLRWRRGNDLISSYNVPDSLVRRVFCRRCGTTLPFVSQNGQFLVVPVGVLSKQPSLQPTEIKSWDERMPWYDAVRGLEDHAGGR